MRNHDLTVKICLNEQSHLLPRYNCPSQIDLMYECELNHKICNINISKGGDMFEDTVTSFAF